MWSLGWKNACDFYRVACSGLLCFDVLFELKIVQYLEIKTHLITDKNIKCNKMQTSTIVFKTEPEFRITSGPIVSSSTSSSSSSGVGNMRPPPPPPPPKIKLHENKLEEPTSSIPDLGEFDWLVSVRLFSFFIYRVVHGRWPFRKPTARLIWTFDNLYNRTFSVFWHCETRQRPSTASHVIF